MNDVKQGASPLTALGAATAILYGTVVVGVLDAADGVLFFGLHGLNPIQVLQYIASGLLGQNAFRGGLAAAGLGVLTHFAISFVVTLLYIAVSRRVAILRQHAVILGLLYGAAVYLIMTFAVLPLTAVAPSPVTAPALVNGLLGHAVFVGLPIALFARKVSA